MYLGTQLLFKKSSARFPGVNPAMTYHSSSVAEKRTRQFLKPFILSPINLSITIYSIHLQKHLFIYKKISQFSLYLSLPISIYPFLSLLYIEYRENNWLFCSLSHFILYILSGNRFSFYYQRDKCVCCLQDVLHLKIYTVVKKWNIQDVRAVEVSFDDDFYKIPGNLHKFVGSYCTYLLPRYWIFCDQQFFLLMIHLGILFSTCIDNLMTTKEVVIEL